MGSLDNMSSSTLVHNFEMGASLVLYPCIFILLLLIHFSSGSQVVTIDVIEAKNLLHSADYHYIDVRTVEEYNKGHVDAQKILNIPYMFNTPEGRVKNPEFLKNVSSIFKEDDRIVVGCQLGIRSLNATADLLKIGFKNVKDMGGGYRAWVENGLPVQEPAIVQEKPKEEL